MADLVKRLNYFNGEFLRKNDFNDEQSYHIQHQRDHARLLHTPGIAEGLDFATLPLDATAVTVNSGVAYDKHGQRIVLPDNTTLELKDIAADQAVYITIAYHELDTDPTDETGVPGKTRWTEAPLIETPTTAPSDTGEKIVLAQIQRTGTVITGIDKSARRVAGVQGGDLEVRSLTLTSESIASGGWVQAQLGASGRADLGGSLRVTGDLVVTGTIQGDIAVGTVQAGDLVNNAVTSAAIAEADGTSAQDTNSGSGVKTGHIQNGAVTNAKLAGDSVVAANIVDGAVGTNELANAAVTNVKLGSDVNTRIAVGETHAASTGNPHGTTATQIDTAGGANQIAARINAGTGIINAARLDAAIARLSQVTAAQINAGPGTIDPAHVDPSIALLTQVTAAQINAGPGAIDAAHIDAAIARLSQVTAAQVNAGAGTIDAAHIDAGIARLSQVNANQVDTAGGTNQIVAQINGGTGIINGARIGQYTEKLNGKTLSTLVNLPAAGLTVNITNRDLRNKLITVRGWASDGDGLTPGMPGLSAATSWNPASLGKEAWAYCKPTSPSGTTVTLFTFTMVTGTVTVTFQLEFTTTPQLNLKISTTAAVSFGYVFQFTWQE